MSSEQREILLSNLRKIEAEISKLTNQISELRTKEVKSKMLNKSLTQEEQLTLGRLNGRLEELRRNQSNTTELLSKVSVD